MTFGKKFLLIWMIVMVLMTIEYLILPDNVLIKGIALGLTTTAVVTVINKIYPTKKKSKS